MNHESPQFNRAEDIFNITMDEFREMAQRDPKGTALLARQAALRITELLEEMPDQSAEMSEAEIAEMRADLSARSTELQTFAASLEH
jgi:hypothetical protein